jgi:membrane protease YdiL (CAAX protease family)
MASVIPAGFILALLYARTKNFWLAMIFHQVFNLVVILQIILHAKGDMVGESLLWAVWGLAWMLTLKPAWKFLRGPTTGPKAKAQALDWAFLGVFGVGLPVAYLLLYT